LEFTHHHTVTWFFYAFLSDFAFFFWSLSLQVGFLRGCGCVAPILIDVTTPVGLLGSYKLSFLSATYLVVIVRLLLLLLLLLLHIQHHGIVLLGGSTRVQGNKFPQLLQANVVDAGEAQLLI